MKRMLIKGTLSNKANCAWVLPPVHCGNRTTKKIKIVFPRGGIMNPPPGYKPLAMGR